MEEGPKLPARRSFSKGGTAPERREKARAAARAKVVAETEAKLARRRSREAAGTTVADRDLKTYEYYLGINRTELEGKRILDIGSGISKRLGTAETFSKEAAKYGADVISMNPELQKPEIRETVRGEAGWLEKIILREKPGEPWRKKSVAGIGQQLPFKDGSFDMVAALYSVPEYIIERRDEDWPLVFKEMLRVLDKDGKAVVYPIEPKTYDSVFFKGLVDGLGKVAEVSFELVNDEPFNDFRMTLKKKTQE